MAMIPSTTSASGAPLGDSVLAAAGAVPSGWRTAGGLPAGGDAVAGKGPDPAAVSANIAANLASFKRQLAADKAQADRGDYARFLKEYGMSEPQVLARSRDKSDQVPLPAGVPVHVAPSALAGDGIFASRNIQPGEVLAPARIGAMRTPAGSTTNHSPNPNAMFVTIPGGGLDMVAMHPIREGAEVLVNYRFSAALSHR